MAVESRWYGWQTLLVAVPSVTVMAVGRYENSVVAFAGLGGFVLALLPPGVLLGAAIATAIDAAFLAREDAPREGATARLVRALPHAEPLPGGAWIGARGAF